jgi:aminodeoxyfutalosine deaminase
VTHPKIELHVHLEGTVQPETLFEIAHRNGHALPVASVDELRRLYAFRDMAHFIEVFVMTSDALQTADDYRRITVEYAEQAAAHGAVYLEAIFSLGLWRGLDSDVVFTGCSDGAEEARERSGVEIRLTPDIARVYSLDEALHTVRYAAKYRDRGVVGVGLGGDEAANPPEPYAPAFELARSEGLASVPHAGEHAGPESIRGALEALGADRIRHGITAVLDRALLEELAERRVVLDVCPISNVCTRAVASLEEHPLPQLVEAGVICSISTDDPAMFGTDLTREYTVAASLSVDARAAYAAGLEGALCDEETKARLHRIAEEFDWTSVDADAEVEVP